MWFNNCILLLRRLKDSLAVLLMGIGIILPPGSADAMKTPTILEKQSIEQRVANVREHIRRERFRQQLNQIDKDSEQRSGERLTQWLNWPNWPNWGNWNNWPNWPNWGNWRNF